MKRCPKCNLNYSDNTLEFCLEDGTRLDALTNNQTNAPTITLPNKSTPSTEKTLNLPFSNPAQTLEFQAESPLGTKPQTNLLKEKVVQQSNKVLELAPIVVALAHNWWQWIYLNNQYYSTFSGYFLSVNFLMWLLLLVLGAVLGLIALKRCQNKAFAITSLVILSVNLLLFLVPKR